MADYRSSSLQAPQRKPLPGNAGLQFFSSESPISNQTLSHDVPPVGQYRPRTASSSFTPNNTMPPLRQTTSGHHPQQQYGGGGAIPSRRQSSSTTCTTSTGGNGNPTRQMTNLSTDVRRSLSSHTSSNTQVGYVALMRRQKATVWCDRAQSEDPRLAAKRRQAKHRALLEVHGGSSSRNSTLISAGKIRHNSNTRASSYNTSTMIGAGVPLRLSANEIGTADDDVDERDSFPIHRRTGSGRSSVGSGRPPGAYQRPQQPRFSSGSGGNTPLSFEQAADGRPDIPDIVETPAPIKPDERENEYFLNKPNSATGESGPSELNTKDRPSTSHTNTNSENEDEFGQITEMVTPSGATAAAQKRKVAHDLKRRGSVDDRTSSMTGVRLFVANPDLSD